MSRVAALACVLGLLSLALVLGCSDPPAKPAPAQIGMPSSSGGLSGAGSGSVGSSVDGGADADIDGGVCNSVVENGGTVDRVGIIGDPPTAIGGTVVDGSYDLTDYSVYVGTGGVAGPTGITAKATIIIAGGKIDEAIDTGGTGKTVTSVRTTSVYSATGATIAETATCPAGSGGKQLNFTANDPTIIFTDLTTKEAFTFTKR